VKLGFARVFGLHLGHQIRNVIFHRWRERLQKISLSATGALVDRTAAPLVDSKCQSGSDLSTKAKRAERSISHAACGKYERASLLGH
jgi:hypothetical protein